MCYRHSLWLSQKLLENYKFSSSQNSIGIFRISVFRTWSHEFQPLPSQESFWIRCALGRRLSIISNWAWIFCDLIFYGLKHGFCSSKSYSQNFFPNFVTEKSSALNFRPNEQTGHLNHFAARGRFRWWLFFISYWILFVEIIFSNCNICCQLNLRIVCFVVYLHNFQWCVCSFCLNIPGCTSLEEAILLVC